MEFQIAESVEELKAASQLVYREYVNRGYVDPQNTEIKLSIFHAIPGSTTFIAVHPDLGVCGTVTLIQDSPLGLPMDAIYRGELNALREQGHHLAEASMLAFDRSFLRRQRLPRFHVRQMMLTLRLFKALFDYLRTSTSATELVACFHPRHQVLYDFLCLEPLAGVRSYAAVNGHPAVARHFNLSRGQHLASIKPILQFFYSDSLLHSMRPSAFSMDDVRALFERPSSLSLPAIPS